MDLTISNILSSDQPGDTTMAFTVTNVMNPYSTYPRTGFTITTQDDSGGSIDQYTGMTFTVTDWGTLNNPSIGRLDSVT